MHFTIITVAMGVENGSEGLEGKTGGRGQERLLQLLVLRACWPGPRQKQCPQAQGQIWGISGEYSGWAVGQDGYGWGGKRSSPWQDCGFRPEQQVDVGHLTHEVGTVIIIHYDFLLLFGIAMSLPALHSVSELLCIRSSAQWAGGMSRQDTIPVLEELPA